MYTRVPVYDHAAAEKGLTSAPRRTITGTQTFHEASWRLNEGACLAGKMDVSKGAAHLRGLTCPRCSVRPCHGQSVQKAEESCAAIQLQMPSARLCDSDSAT